MTLVRNNIPCVTLCQGCTGLPISLLSYTEVTVQLRFSVKLANKVLQLDATKVSRYLLWTRIVAKLQMTY